MQMGPARAPQPTRGAQVGGPTLGPSGWAQAGPQWVGPSRAHVGGPKPGPSGWAHAGSKWVGPSWAQVGPSQKFGTPKKSKILKIKIRSARNVGKVWISRKKSTWPHLGPSWANFLCGPEKLKNRCQRIFLGGPMGPIHPVWDLRWYHSVFLAGQ